MTLEETYLQPGHYHCPECAAPEKSFSVFVTLEGDMRGVCHRASCGYKSGTLSSLPDRRQAPGRYSRRYLGEFGTNEQLDAIRGRIRARFEICLGTNCTAAGETLLGVYDPFGRFRGYLKRAIFWGETGSGPKTVAYPEDLEQPFISWFNSGKVRPIVLVEDIISAWKVTAAGYCGVALLGNALNAEKVREIARNGGTTQEVILALDADATALAFEQARKWGLAFKRCRVAILQRDLKDEPIEDIANILGL